MNLARREEYTYFVRCTALILYFFNHTVANGTLALLCSKIFSYLLVMMQHFYMRIRHLFIYCRIRMLHPVARQNQPHCLQAENLNMDKLEAVVTRSSSEGDPAGKCSILFTYVKYTHMYIHSPAEIHQYLIFRSMKTKLSCKVCLSLFKRHSDIAIMNSFTFQTMTT